MATRKERDKAGKGQKSRESAKGKSGKRRQARRWKPPRVPPPDSTVWPEQYRGKNWKPVYAILFAGRCQLCAYSCPLSKWRQLLDKFHGQSRLLLCTNHPDCPFGFAPGRFLRAHYEPQLLDWSRMSSLTFWLGRLSAP